MSFALNTDTCTKHITLSSTGQFNGPLHNSTFYLTSDMRLHDTLMHLVSVESIQFTHPTFCSMDYMKGSVTIAAQGAVPITRVVSEANFDDF